MKKLVLIGSIVSVVIVTIIIIWTLTAGAGFLWKQFPSWIAEGEKMVSEAIRKVEELLPGLKERAKEVAPRVAEKVKEIIPGEIPAEDVPGEDLKQVPRYPGLIRVSYAMTDQKRTIVYRGRMEFKETSNFYQKEMVRLGFNKKVISASPEKEIYEYRKRRQRLEFRFKKISTIRSEITELTVKEM
ncbi:MAG: hypothetical protein FJ240_06170 [Nitrospira sp.]|nr:hypothetical protein [Nitrospira sp.]